MKRSSIGVLGAALALVIGSGLVAPRAARADKVVCKDNTVVEGRIIEETPEWVRIEFKKGSIIGQREIPRSEIKEIIKEDTPQQKYEKAIAAAKTADELVQLAKKATEEQLPKLAQKAYEEAIKKDPEHAAARAALGWKKVDGKWLSEREWKLKEGWKEDPKTKQLVSPEDWAKRQTAEKDKKKADAEKAQGDFKKELEGTGEWFIIETKDHNYKIRCNSTKDVAQRYADFMVKIRTEYDKVFKSYERFWKGQSVIYIFRNNEDFKAFAEDAAGVGGFYRPKSENTNAYPDRIVAAFHGAFGTGDTREVLAHECTHQIEHILCNGDADAEKNAMEFLMRPTWWMEGYATYFGDGFHFDKKGSLEIIIPRMRLNPIQQMIKSGQVPTQLPISKFVRWGLRQYQMMAGVAYPYGWSLIYYFKKRGEVPVKGKKGQFEQKPVKIKVDGKDRDVNLAKVLEDYFKVIAQKPPAELNPMTNPDAFGEYYAKKLDELLGFPVDALTDDWKQFIGGLEPPSFGKVDKAKRKFIATEGGFEVECPSAKGWKFNEEDCVGDEAIRLENADTGALVKIEVDGNMENDPLETESGGSGIKDNVSNGIGRSFAGATTEVDEKTTVAGIESAWQFVYTGTEQALMPGQKVKTTEQKVWHLVIGGATMKRTYQIICMSDKDKFDENKPLFDKIVNSFKLLKEQ